MASPSSSNEQQVGNNLWLPEMKKRKRMQSNRESARRSRLRRKKHLEDLMGVVTKLKAENSEILSTTTATTQLYLDVQAENSVLRAQLADLHNRLQFLNNIIISCLINNNSRSLVSLNTDTTSPNMTMATMGTELGHKKSIGSFDHEFDDGLTMNSWGLSYPNYPIMPTQDALVDMLI